LVGPGFDGDAGERAERPGRGAEPDTQRRAQQPGAGRVTQVGRSGRWEHGWTDIFEAGEYGGGVVVAAAQRAQDEQIGSAVGEDDPLPASGVDETPWGEGRGGHDRS